MTRRLSTLISTDAQAALAEATEPSEANPFVTRADLDEFAEDSDLTNYARLDDLDPLARRDELNTAVPVAVKESGGTQLAIGALAPSQWVRRLGAQLVGDPGPAPVRDISGFISQALTAANFESALMAAIAGAANTPSGLQLAVPPGLWYMSQSIVLRGLSRNKSVSLIGAGRYVTRLEWAPSFAGNGLVMDGVSAADGTEKNCYWSTVKGISFHGGQNTAGGNGLFMRACIMCRVSDCAFEHWDTGIGVWADGLRTLDGGYLVENSQNCTFDDVHVVLNKIGMKLRSTAVFTFQSIWTNNNSERDILLDGYVSATFYNLMCQSGVEYSIATSTPNQGNNIIAIYGGYHEGTGKGLLKVSPVTVSYDSYSVQDFLATSYTGPVFDVSGSNVSLFTGRILTTYTTQYIKARHLTSLNMMIGPDPDASPEAYDIDDYTRRWMSIQTTYSGRPYFGSMSQAENVTELLRPAASAIWDPRVASSVSVVSGELASITDVIQGAVAAPATTPQRPYWTASDSSANGQPTITLAKTGNRNLKGTLGSPMAVGSSPGLFVVFKKFGASTTVGFSGPGLLGPTNADQISSGMGDGNSPGVYGAGNTGGAGAYAIRAAAIDTSFHAMLVQNTVAANTDEVSSIKLYLDGEAIAATGGAGTEYTAAALSRFWFSVADGSDAQSSDLTIAYLCFLKRRLSPGEIKQLFQFANATWAIGRTPRQGAFQVGYGTAGTYAYTVPQGFRVRGAYVAGAASGGGAGAAGGAGRSNATSGAGGGGGGGASAGQSAKLLYVPCSASAGNALSIVVGTGGTGATGGIFGGAAPNGGSTGTDTTITNTTLGREMVHAIAAVFGGGNGATGTTATATTAAAAGGGGATVYGPWPFLNLGTIAPGGQGGGAGGASTAAGGGSGVPVALDARLYAGSGVGATPLTAPPTPGTGGANAAGTFGGGGAGGCGAYVAPGWEIETILGAIAPTSGAGSAQAGNGGTGGAGNAATAANGTSGTNGFDGTKGRGGGAGGGGGGGGAGTTGGNGGNGGNGGKGSDGAVILELEPV